MKKFFFAIIFSSILFNCHVFASSSSSCSSHRDDPQRLGRKLVNFFWNLVLEKDVTGLTQIISPEFQGGEDDGPIRNRYDEIQFLVNSTLQAFSVKDFDSRRFGQEHVLVISYRFEPINSTLKKGKALDVWQKIGDCWILMSHSFFNDLI